MTFALCGVIRVFCCMEIWFSHSLFQHIGDEEHVHLSTLVIKLESDRLGYTVELER